MPPEPPRRVREALSVIGQSVSMSDGIEAMSARAAEFATPFAAKLAGVFLNEEARLYFEECLDEMWATTPTPREAQEIVIGSGLHAAIYCAVRVASGFPKPLVIEAKERAGGTFAVSRNASFFLNSANRPGNLGIPGRAEALNIIPGAPVQPADLSSEEYQPNSSLAFSIRATLAMNAKVLVGRRVASADSTCVTLDDGRRIKATRVIYATGLGEPIVPPEADGKHLMSYMEFLAHLDQQFPLQGISTVAVVGAGDAGRTTIEALTGQGPRAPWSVASLDYVRQIDWYGVSAECISKDGWRENNRSRYGGIARLLPLTGTGLKSARVKPITRRASESGIGFGGAYVDGARYDLVIWAAGFKPMNVEGTVEYKAGGRSIARMMESGLFVVGPAAQIDTATEANVPDKVPENSAAVFRYADRTAAFAMHLPQLALPDGGAMDGSKVTTGYPDYKAADPGSYGVGESV